MATCRARPGERPRDTYSWVSSSSSSSGVVSSRTRSLASWPACWSRSARSLEYSTAPMASVPATSPANPPKMSTLEPTPAPANPSHIPAEVRMPSLASGTYGPTQSAILPAAPFIMEASAGLGGDALEGVGLDEAEQVAGHPAHLDLLGALGDAVPPVVPVDVLERPVPRVAQAAVHLHGAVRGVAAQPVGHVVAHGDLVRLGERPVGVHAPGRLVDQRAQHLGLGLQLDQRELDGLVARQRLAERLAGLRVLDRAIDAELGGAQAGGGLPDAVLVEEVLHEEQAAALGAEDGAVRDPDVVQRDAAVVGRHVEGPQVLLDLEAGGADRDQEPGDAGTAARGAAGAGEDQVVRGGVDAGVPGLLPGDDPVFAVFGRGRLHEGGVAAVLGFGDAEREVAFARGEVVDPVLLLRRAAVVQHQQQADVVAHDRVLVLQVAVQAEALARQVLADHRHAQVGAVPAAVLLREGVPEVAGSVGPAARLGEQFLPLPTGQAAAVPVGPGVLPAVVEEPFVVVLLLERLDLALDELVEFGQVVAQVLGEGEVHGSPYPGMARWAGLATMSLSTTAARVASVTSPKRWSSEPSRIFAQRSLSSAQPRPASRFRWASSWARVRRASRSAMRSALAATLA